MRPLLDRFDRPLRSLRLSVTDRCNLRCQYCMPELDYVWLPRHDILTFEELGTLVGAFCDVGVSKVRITGGEPLLRRDVDTLIGQLAAQPAVDDLALTTNGLLLAEMAPRLKAAGLNRVTVSLDTLRPDRFARLTRYDRLPVVLDGIAAAREHFGGLKIDTVVIRGINDDELAALLEFGRAHAAEVRFIEYMDVGGATRWTLADVVSRREMLARLETAFGPATPLASDDWAPADRFRLADGTTFGIISSTTAPFCTTCDRGRLTADGVFLRCLYATRGLDLRSSLREGASRARLAEQIADVWRERDDRGAVERLQHDRRGAFVPIADLKRQPHLEMHTRGG
ncbi:MAG: GTP 3',8-cyclase MoaA [Vicinamibacterales bacterium]